MIVNIFLAQVYCIQKGNFSQRLYLHFNEYSVEYHITIWHQLFVFESLYYYKRVLYSPLFNFRDRWMDVNHAILKLVLIH